MSLTDDSLMPFGKYAGEKLADVPAVYLLWLGDKISKSKARNKLSATEFYLVKYVEENKEVLEKEIKEKKS